MNLFRIEDTEDHEDYILLSYAVVVFLLAFFIRHNPINQAFGRIDVDTIHHDVLTRALQWVSDKIEDENSDLSSVSTFTDTLVACREERGEGDVALLRGTSNISCLPNDEANHA